MKGLPDEVKRLQEKGVKIIQMYAEDEETNEEYNFYFRKPNKAEYKRNLDKLLSAQMGQSKSFSFSTHAENMIKGQIVYPAKDDFQLFIDENISVIPEFYGRLFGEVDKKIDFLSQEI